MKKIIKNRIFIVIICGIIFTSLGVYGANNYNAREISYNPSNGVATNVEDALNEIYDIKELGDATSEDILEGKTAIVKGNLITGTLNQNEVNVVQYGSQYANLTTSTFSLTGIKNYNKLVLNKNLFVIISIVQGNIENGDLGGQQSYVNISYNKTTGNLTVKNSNNACFVYFYIYYIPQ